MGHCSAGVTRVVFHEQRQAGGMGDVGDGGDVEDFEARVADGFAEEQAGVGTDRVAPGLHVAWRHEGGGDPEAGQGVGQQVVGATVQRAGRDDVAAAAHQRGDGEHQRGLATGAGNGADAAIQRRDALFEHGVGGVGDARIDVAGAFLVEQGGGVVAALEDVAGGEVDRGGPGAVGGVRGLAGVQGERVGPGVSVDRHGVRGR